MRAKEFIAERRQVNEAFPLLAAIPYIGASLAAMSAFALAFHILNLGLTAWSAKMIWDDYQDKAEAFGPNVLDWPQEEKDAIKEDIFWTGVGSLVIGLAPKLIGAIKKLFTTIPKEAQDQALKEVAPKIEGEFKKIIEKNKASKSTPGGNPATKSTMGDKGINAPSTTSAKATPSDIEKDRARIMGTEKPVDPKQAELKKKLQGQPETPQEKLKRELQAKQAAKEK